MKSFSFCRSWPPGCNALTDSAPRSGAGDKLLLNADRNPNSTGARLIGISPAAMGSNLPKIAADIAAGQIKTLLVFGEDVTRFGIGGELLLASWTH